MSSLLQNPIVMAVLNVTLALYAASIAPKLPPNVTEMLGNTYVKIAFIAVMIVLAGFDAQMAVLIAVVYVALINVASGRSFLESFTQDENRKFAMIFMLGQLTVLGEKFVTQKGNEFMHPYLRGQPLTPSIMKWYIGYLVQTGNLPPQVLQGKIFRGMGSVSPEKPRTVSKEVMVYIMGLRLLPLMLSGDITLDQLKSLNGNLLGIILAKKVAREETCIVLKKNGFITPNAPIC